MQPGSTMQEPDNCEPKFVEEFIALYKSFPCLWRPMSKVYADQKRRAYDALVQKYREVDPHATSITVKRKINALRTGFRKQLRRLNRKSVERKPTLWYFHLFDFLDDYPRADESDQVEGLESQGSDEEYDGSDDSLRHSSLECTTQRVQELEELVEERLHSFLENDSSLVYGKHIANKLRTVSALQNKFAQKLINDIVFEAEMGSLTRGCTLAGMDNAEL
uniref:MADF domain-containing protein n=1 Tax=Anopheles dirus TaxID=7168 RepID=A0A182NRF2_9DIPT